MAPLDCLFPRHSIRRESIRRHLIHFHANQLSSPAAGANKQPAPRECRQRAGRLASEAERGQLGLVIVDYLQLMSGRGRFENRTLELASISRSLKGLAKELRVPIVVLSQLSRAPEARSDHRPQLSDLRESGALEQDADVVILIYRDDAYNRDPNSPDAGTAELIVAKQRNGPTGTVRLAFLREQTRFANLAAGG